MAKRPFAIEALNTPPDQLAELKQFLDSGKGDSNARKSMMARLTGRCIVCRLVPTTIVKYRTQGIIKIERYCDNCLSKRIQSS